MDQQESIYIRSVVVSYDDWPEELDGMVSWCEINTSGKWSYGLHHSPPDGKIVHAFYFDNDIDQFGFKLTWGLH